MCFENRLPGATRIRGAMLTQHVGDTPCKVRVDLFFQASGVRFRALSPFCLHCEPARVQGWEFML